MDSKSFSVRALTYSAICIALATILSYVKLFQMPQGGTVTACSMLFIALVGYMFGLRAGIIAGVAHGLLQLAFGGYVVHPAQLILDYPLAFGMLGLSGLLRNTKYGLFTGYILGAVGRLACSVASGVIFFAEYAPPETSVFVYSLSYNASYIVPEAIITLAILFVPNIRGLIDKLKSEAKA